MKTTTLFFSAAVTLCSIRAWGQQMTIDEWNEQAKTNIRLLPKYGYAVKTQDQKMADQEFIESALKQYPLPIQIFFGVMAEYI